jgi:hypothetical protein
MSANLENIIRDFTAQLQDAIRAQVLAEVEDAIADVLRQGGGRRAAGKKALVATARGRGAGGKRTPKQIERDAAKLFDYIKANPGKRAEQIAQETGTPTGDMSLPIKKLLAAGRIKAQGKARGTTYTAVGK